MEKNCQQNGQEFSYVAGEDIEDKLERCLLLPIAPQELMYKSSSSPNNLTLLNSGDISAGMTKKLDEWTVTSIFPSTNTANLPYVIKSNFSKNRILKLQKNQIHIFFLEN